MVYNPGDLSTQHTPGRVHGQGTSRRVAADPRPRRCSESGGPPPRLTRETLISFLIALVLPSSSSGDVILGNHLMILWIAILLFI